MVCDVIINLKEEREKVKWCTRGNEIRPIRLQSARIGNPPNQICAIHPPAAYCIVNFHLFQIADEAVDFVIRSRFGTNTRHPPKLHVTISSTPPPNTHSVLWTVGCRFALQEISPSFRTRHRICYGRHWRVSAPPY